MSVDLDRTRPIWRQIAAVSVGRIEDGTYPAGTWPTRARYEQLRDEWVAAVRGEMTTAA
ncbi:hypothetical protein ACWDBD_21755 [Streptomyces sp. NPDC001118]